MSLIEVTDLRVELTDGNDVVDGISFAIEPGEVLGLVGESGSGKTTIAVTLLGDARRGAKISGGQVVVDGNDILEMDNEQLRGVRGTAVSYIPQDPSAALNPAIRIRRQLAELFIFHRSDEPEEHISARIAEVLDEVGLPSDDEFLSRFPHQLSGGQQQRVAIAMAFLLRPKVIVLDEPTTGLDVTTQARVLRTIRELCETHRVAALYVTHDLAVVANLAHRIIVLYAGRMAEVGTREQIFNSPSHPYTRRLIAAVPVLEERRSLVAIEGHAPAPGVRPSGCAFHTRCPEAIPRCAAEAPPPIELHPGQVVRCLRATELKPGPLGTIEVAHGQTSDAVAPLLSVRDLDAFHGSRQILHDISFELRPKECLALVGESGSGKTTLSRCVIGLHGRQTGVIELKGEPLASHARERGKQQRQTMQYIFQSPYNSLNPRQTIGEILRVPLRQFYDMNRSEMNERVAEALERVSLSRRTAAQRPHMLSGGERQRVAIARALVSRPDVLICDEITSALDVSVQAATIRLLRQLQDEDGLAMLFVTHNLALVRTIADRVLTMNQGHIVETGPVAQILDKPAQEYTRRLIADTPKMIVGPGASSEISR